MVQLHGELCSRNVYYIIFISKSYSPSNHVKSSLTAKQSQVTSETSRVFKP